MLNRDRAELWEYYKKNDDVARYGGLRPSRIRPVCCSPADRHTIARVLIRVVGPVKVLPAPSYYSWCCPSTDRGPMDLGGAWKSREG